VRLDTHQHFWRYDPAQHVWMTDAMGVLRRDYLPADLEPLLGAAGFDGTIAVQARQVVEETDWLLQLADAHPFIQGVVGWVDLRSPQVGDRLERYARHPKLVGVRHVVHDEPDDAFVLRADFRAGIARLREFDLTYDLLLFPRHLPLAARLVEEFPEQPFVLDHIAKPFIRDGLLSPWKDDLQRLAAFKNVYCKLSGWSRKRAGGSGVPRTSTPTSTRSSRPSAWSGSWSAPTGRSARSPATMLRPWPSSSTTSSASRSRPGTASSAGTARASTASVIRVQLQVEENV